MTRSVGVFRFSRGEDRTNPVLIGETSIGKTVISEELAQRIVQGDVSQALINIKLISLDMGALIAGAKYPGEFEDSIIAMCQCSQHLVCEFAFSRYGRRAVTTYNTVEWVRYITKAGSYEIRC